MTAFKGLGTYGNAVGVVTPLDHKLADASLITKASGNLIRTGLFWGGTATIVTGTAGMAYSVAGYTCATTRGVSSGAVIGGNDGALSVSTSAAPGSNSRYDVVYHWHREFSLDGTDSNPVIGVIQGTAAASPTVPSLAAFPGAIALATILVPAGVTATNSGTTITQTAPFTATAGAAIMFRNLTEANAATVIDGTRGMLLDTGVNINRVSGAWVQEVTTGTFVWVAYYSTVTANKVTRDNRTGLVNITARAFPPAAVTDGSSIATIPAGFRPATDMELPVSATVGGSAVTATLIVTASTGDVKVYGAGSNKTLSIAATYAGA